MTSATRPASGSARSGSAHSGRASFFSRLYTGPVPSTSSAGARPGTSCSASSCWSASARSSSAGSTSGSTSRAAPRSSSRPQAPEPRRRSRTCGRSTRRRVGQEPAAVQTVGQGDRASVLIRSEPLNASQIVTLRQALFDRFQPFGSGGQPSVVGDQHHRRERHLGWPDHPAGAHRPGGVPGPRHDLPGVLLRARDGRRGAGRARPRRGRDDGRLLDRRVRGHPGDGDRAADDPRLLALRHRRGLRQGQGEHPRAPRA